MTSVGAADSKVLEILLALGYAHHAACRGGEDGDLVISCGDAMGGVGMRRIAVAHGPEGWTTTERWTSAGLKPSFNDFMIHDGNVFRVRRHHHWLASTPRTVNASGRGSRYGARQLVLLRDQGRTAGVVGGR